jgi:hypothetical protein
VGVILPGERDWGRLWECRMRLGKGALWRPLGSRLCSNFWLGT